MDNNDNSKKIVIVDDEKIITSSLKILLQLERYEDLAVFNSPVEALGYIRENPVNLILSDFLMPKMNGIEFLSEVKKIKPEVTMILLTGYADKENAIRAINEIGLYRYLEKPWDNEDLLLTIKNGLERTNLVEAVTMHREINRLRDDFVATLTHDLRTPLLAAIQALGFFLDGTLGDLSEKQKILLETMKNSNEDMLGLVNSLLEVYKHESGQITLYKSNFGILELLNQCYQELTPLLEKKNINLKVNCPEIEIYADRSELKRVITNLLGNAVNHTNENGNITIEALVINDDVQVNVTDTGIGIPKEDIPKIFSRFSQGTTKKRSTGTGLGLYLSRQIIEAHNGKIWLESKVEQGSKFSFILYSAKKSGNFEREIEHAVA